MELIRQSILDKLEVSIDKSKVNFVFFCYDLPTENIEDISKKEKDLLHLKRINVKNKVKRFASIVQQSVYMLPYDKLDDLVEMIESEYSDVDLNKFKVDILPLGVGFDSDLIKEIIVKNITEIEEEARNFIWTMVTGF